MTPIKKWQNQFQCRQGKKHTPKTGVINSSLAVGIYGYYSVIVFRAWHAIWHVLLLNRCPTCVNTFSHAPTIPSSLFVLVPCAHCWPCRCVNSLSPLGTACFCHSAWLKIKNKSSWCFALWCFVFVTVTLPDNVVTMNFLFIKKFLLWSVCLSSLQRASHYFNKTHLPSSLNYMEVIQAFERCGFREQMGSVLYMEISRYILRNPSFK